MGSEPTFEDKLASSRRIVDGANASVAQLELLSETLHLPPGVKRIGAHGLVFDPNVSESELLAVGRRLFAVRSYTKWALGALFAQMVRVREARREVSRRAKKDNSAGNEWAGEFATSHHIDPKEFREMLGVVTFYRIGEAEGGDVEGLKGLEFEHYREAMWAVDDSKPGQRVRAIAHLREAAGGGMSVTQMRRHIRSTGATEMREPEQRELAEYGAVFQFQRWAKRQMDDVSNYTPERARLILQDLGDETLSYIDALRDIAAGGDAKRIAKDKKTRRA